MAKPAGYFQMKTGFLYLTEADVDRGVKGSVPPVWVLWVSGSSGSVEGLWRVLERSGLRGGRCVSRDDMKMDRTILAHVVGVSRRIHKDHGSYTQS